MDCVGGGAYLAAWLGAEQRMTRYRKEPHEMEGDMAGVRTRKHLFSSRAILVRMRVREPDIVLIALRLDGRHAKHVGKEDRDKRTDDEVTH